jgi:hypothetical protein
MPRPKKQLSHGEQIVADYQAARKQLADSKLAKPGTTHYATHIKLMATLTADIAKS